MEKDLQLRKATKKDCKLVFQWANDTETRNNSFNKDSITWEIHEKWFNDKMLNCSDYYILESYEKNIGQIRLDRKEDENIINYSIDSEYRGKGYGKKIIELFEERLLLNKEFKVITAYVKRSNVKSVAIFESLHYKKEQLDDKYKFQKKLGDNVD